MMNLRLPRRVSLCILGFIGAAMLLIPGGVWASSAARAHVAPVESTPTPAIPPARYGAVIPADWDVNGDGVLDYTDVDAKAGELAGMTSYIRLQGGCVAIDTPVRTASEACAGR